VVARFRDELARKGHAKRLFHGTGLGPRCGFGIDPRSGPCGGGGCALCSICRRGFSLDAAGRHGGSSMALRYGRGLYFSATSGKSHDYAGGSKRARPDGSGRAVSWFVMLLCSVAVGRPYETARGHIPEEEVLRLVRGEQGGSGGDGNGDSGAFGSVSGLVGPDLNYDETVVYDEAAALPSFLVAYTMT